MKAVKYIVNTLLALAAIAGIVYVAATYGDKIVAWCKKMIASLPCCKNSDCICEDDICEEAPAEEAAAEEAPAEEAVAEEADFEG